MSIKEQGGNLKFKSFYTTRNVIFKKNGNEVSKIAADAGFYDRGSGVYDYLYSSNFGALNGKGTIFEPNSNYPSGAELKLPYSKYTNKLGNFWNGVTSYFQTYSSVGYLEENKFVVFYYSEYYILDINPTTGEVTTSSAYSYPTGVTQIAHIEKVDTDRYVGMWRGDNYTKLVQFTYSPVSETLTFSTTVLSTPTNNEWAYPSLTALDSSTYILSTTNLSGYVGNSYIITADANGLISISSGFIWTASNAYYVKIAALSATKFIIIWSKNGVSYTVGTYDSGTSSLSYTTESTLTDGSAGFLVGKKIPNRDSVLIYGRHEVTIVNVDLATDTVTNNVAEVPLSGPNQSSYPTPFSIDVSPDGTKFALTYDDSSDNNYLSLGTIDQDTVTFDITERIATNITANGNIKPYVFFASNTSLRYVYNDYSNENNLGGVGLTQTTSFSALQTTPFAGIFDSSDNRLYTPGSVWTTTGLTPAATYYCQADGTISLTPDSANTIAGKAISTTQMIVGE